MGNLLSRSSGSKTKTIEIGLNQLRHVPEDRNEKLFSQLVHDIPSDRNKLFKYTLVTPDAGSDVPRLNVEEQLLLKLAKHVNPFWQGEDADMSRFSVLGDDDTKLKLPASIDCFRGIIEKRKIGEYRLTTVSEARKDVQILINSDSIPVRASRALGCMFGMVCGDALGHTLEFTPVRYDSHQLLTGMVGGGRFMLQPGQWTDDTSMGLCILDSFLIGNENSGDFKADPLDIMLRFVAWWFLGYNNAFGYDTEERKVQKHSVGLGGNISQSLRKFIENGEASTSAGDVETSGNGSIMRMAPVPILFWDNVDEACRYAREISLTTHQGEEAAECCRLLAHVCSKAIEKGSDATVKDTLGNLGEEFYSKDSRVMSLARAEQEASGDENRNWKWKSNVYKYSPLRSKMQPGYVGSYAMDCLSMAMHCVWTTTSFEAAILKCVNMGGDADSVGSVCGQIAGAIYGIETIPQNWIEAVQKWDRSGDIALKTLLSFYKVSLVQAKNIR